jgi:hypothetical protein
MIIVDVPGSLDIIVGDETVFYSEQAIEVGTDVGIRRNMKGFLGIKNVAVGKIISKCKDEAGAPLAPTRTGHRRRNAWKNLYRVRVTEILV